MKSNKGGVYHLTRGQTFAGMSRCPFKTFSAIMDIIHPFNTTFLLTSKQPCSVCIPQMIIYSMSLALLDLTGHLLYTPVDIPFKWSANSACHTLHSFLSQMYHLR